MKDITNLLEPVTYDNIHTLKSGEWIWDNKIVKRRAHDRSLNRTTISEPIGFRLVDAIDLKDFSNFTNKRFMLSDIDSSHGGFNWTFFENGRFFMFGRGDRIGGLENERY